MTHLINGNAFRIPLADKSVHCVVTSPPYWNLRDYGTSGQLGLEPLHDCLGWARGENCGACYVCVTRLWCAEVWRVLRDDGTLWIVIGDSYAANRGYQVPDSMHRDVGNNSGAKVPPGLKPKDLCMIPARVALALQADGWYLRSDVIWCLSGGAWLYARTQKGDTPMMVRDVARLDPSTVKLWNGEKWTQLKGMSKSKRKGNELEIVLRSGERISCTPSHKFPTQRGLLQASELVVGDKLKRTTIPEPARPLDSLHITPELAWFAGLYLAEGSMSGSAIQIAGHIKEQARWDKVQKIARDYGGSATRTIDGNKMDIRVYGKMLFAAIDLLVTGKTAHDKGFSPVVWKYSNEFVAAMLDGYLSGDGHDDKKNNRWRLGFTRNYNLERDLRTACARLGYHLVLNMSTSQYQGGTRQSFRGEIRKERSGHRNERDTSEVVEIRKARCGYVYDLGVEDEPHLFALAGGILTHNSKPNPMPGSQQDRPTTAHEYVFLLAKSKRYYYDNEAIKEDASESTNQRDAYKRVGYRKENRDGFINHLDPNSGEYRDCGGKRTKRTVWTIATQPYSSGRDVDHFATYPPALVEPCIKAGTSERGVCPACGAGWVRVVERTPATSKKCPKTDGLYNAQGGTGEKKTGTIGMSGSGRIDGKSTTTGWLPSCQCNAGEPVQAIVLDPFAGSGTTLLVARQLGRRGIGLDLSMQYLTECARPRLSLDALDEWQNGRDPVEANLDGLPLFGV